MENFPTAKRSAITDLENGEGMIVQAMEKILKGLALSFWLLSIPVFLYILMVFIPSL
jgi:hypothetical protein